MHSKKVNYALFGTANLENKLNTLMMNILQVHFVCLCVFPIKLKQVTNECTF